MATNRINPSSCLPAFCPGCGEGDGGGCGDFDGAGDRVDRDVAGDFPPREYWRFQVSVIDPSSAPISRLDKIIKQIKRYTKKCNGKICLNLYLNSSEEVEIKK